MEKYFENIIAPNMCIFRIRIKGGNVMDEEQLREKYIYYIRNKRRKKFYSWINNNIWMHLW